MTQDCGSGSGIESWEFGPGWINCFIKVSGQSERMVETRAGVAPLLLRYNSEFPLLLDSNGSMTADLRNTDS
jgi:hypothetical protein